MPMNKNVKIGDIIEVKYGTGTQKIVVDQVYSDEDIRGHDPDGHPIHTGLDELVRVHGNIADLEEDSF